MSSGKPKDTGWLPPRSGGYSPGKTQKSVKNPSGDHVVSGPPKGGAGVGKGRK
jgi:hypothetical protein